MLALDLNKNLYHKYHLTNKLLLPSFIINYGLYKINPDKSKYFTLINSYLFGFHSAYSTATIITDYIKPKNIKFIARGSNLFLHGLAITGYTYSVFKDSKILM